MAMSKLPMHRVCRSRARLILSFKSMRSRFRFRRITFLRTCHKLFRSPSLQCRQVSHFGSLWHRNIGLHYHRYHYSFYCHYRYCSFECPALGPGWLLFLSILSTPELSMVATSISSSSSQTSSSSSSRFIARISACFLIIFRAFFSALQARRSLLTSSFPSSSPSVTPKPDYSGCCVSYWRT